MIFDKFFTKRAEYTEQEHNFIKAFGLDGSVSGDALKETTYFTCIKIISEAVAKVPLYLYKDDQNGTTKATSNKLFDLLSLRPNPYMTAIDFWRVMEANRQHYGRACAYIERDRKGNIKNLYPVKFTDIIVDNNGLFGSISDEKIILVCNITGTNLTFDCLYSDIIDLKGFSLDGVRTNSIRDMIAETINTNRKSQAYLNNLYDNGLTNKVVVQLTSDIQDEKELNKIQAKFKRLYSSDGRIFTVPAGFNISAMNLSLSDAQYEQIRKMSITQIASSFGIKMFMLNDLSDTNNNSLEQQQLSFLIDTLLILFESIEQEINWKLLKEVDRLQGYKFRFNTNVILRTSAQVQADILTKYVSSGIYTPNEARLLLQMTKKTEAEDLIVNAGVLKIKDIGAAAAAAKGGE